MKSFAELLKPYPLNKNTKQLLLYTISELCTLKKLMAGDRNKLIM